MAWLADNCTKRQPTHSWVGETVRPARLAVGELFGAAATVMPWALAIELIHTYSLNHDDLPAMDDDFRRGAPRVTSLRRRHCVNGDALLKPLVPRGFLYQPSLDLNSFRFWQSGGEAVGGQIEDLYGSLTNLDDLVRITAAQDWRSFGWCDWRNHSFRCTVSTYRDCFCLRQTWALLFQLTDDILDQSTRRTS